MTKTNKTAYLMILDNETGIAKLHTIEGETLIGSGQECDIRLEADDILPQYMRILPMKDALLVRRNFNDAEKIESGYVGLFEDDYRVPAQNPIYIGERFVIQQLEQDSTEETDSHTAEN